MSIELWTARISTRDPDRFDITRKSGGERGVVFAPSWAILRPALNARANAKRTRDAVASYGGDDGAADADAMAEASADEVEAWAAYVPAYTAEMRASYRANRVAWDALMARSRVVLVCYCADPARCHRTLLAGILGKLGADVRGELPR